MKQFAFLVFTLFILSTCKTYGQSTPYPFEVEISGTGTQALIFIPGFACSGQVWKETIALFDDVYTCHSLTMAGFAGVPPQHDPTFDKWKTGLADYVRQESLGQAILIGHSMGGVLAMALAADHPDLIAKIVVIDALPCLSALQNASFVANPEVNCEPLVSQFTSIPDEQFYQMQQQMIKYMVADTSRHQQIVQWSITSDRNTFAKMYCDFANTDLREKISSIQCPSLILLEARFATIQPAIQAQYKLLKTADLHYADKGLHFIMYDDIKWYTKQLTEFIKQN
ncbi:alpha/beta hydrolase [Rapidithrix thailandica]|uniref:Alpha/beta hydrolase n=1 Tax=Rapidithrix thailandica TaxID=413964 RepID=A0AAW9SDX8_9BACT